TWFGTDDADGTGTRSILHYLHNDLGQRPNSVRQIGDNVEWSYDLTIPAGQTVRLAHFTIIAQDRSAAVAAAQQLETADGFSEIAAHYLDASEISQFANFSWNDAPLAQPGGPYLAMPGRMLTLDATASFDRESPQQSLAFEWDLNYDASGFTVDATGMQ